MTDLAQVLLRRLIEQSERTGKSDMVTVCFNNGDADSLCRELEHAGCISRYQVYGGRARRIQADLTDVGLRYFEK